MFKGKHSWTKDLAIAATVFIAFFLVYLLRSRYDLGLWDEGSNIYEAKRVYDGQVPYRDFHLLYAPGRLYIQAFMFKIFGVTLSTERSYMVLVIASLAAISYILGRQLNIHPWLCIWLTIVVSHNSTSIFLSPSMDRILSSFVAISAMIAYDKSHKKTWLVISGLLCAASILIGQETGTYTFITLACFLCWRSTISSDRNLKERISMLAKEIIIFVGVVSIGVIPFLGYIVLNQAWGNMVRDMFMDPKAYYVHLDIISFIKMLFRYYFCQKDLRTIVFFSRFLLAAIIPPGVVIYLFGKLWFFRKKIVKEDGYLLMLGIFGLGLGMGLTFLFNFHHLLKTLPPTYIMGMLFFEKSWKRFFTVRSYVYKILMSLFASYLALNFLATTVSTFNSYTGPLRKPCWKLELPRAKISIPYRNVIGVEQRGFPFRNEREMKKVLDYISFVVSEGNFVFFVSHGGMFYFLTECDNVTRYDHVNQYVSLPHHQKAMIEDLEKRKVGYVILDYVPFGINYTCKDEMKEYLPLLYEYIMKHYRFEQKVGLYEFWKRID